MKITISHAVVLFASYCVSSVNPFTIPTANVHKFRQRTAFSILGLSSESPELSNEKNLEVAKEAKVDTSSPAGQFGKPLSPEITDFNKAAIGFVKNAVFDTLFPSENNIEDNPNRPYARFYALETIARMPYFSYLSVLHLYETLGWFRKANYLKLHFAESWNELHHLLIMEELGGNKEWHHRFVAQHSAFFYYWFIIGIYLFNPILAYNLNQAVEEHAFETYDHFLTENEAHLKKLKAPEVAKEYYLGSDTYMLDSMQTSKFECDEGQIQIANTRKMPVKCDTLYDVFVAIRDDEAEHVNTMKYLQNQDADIDLKVNEGDECGMGLDGNLATA